MSDASSPQSLSTVKIVYTGEVNEDKIAALASALDEINVKYKSAHDIYLYISSPGGKVDSGNVGYQVIRSSVVPVTTINLSMVGSAATMLYCAGQKRLVLDDTSFLLHAPTRWIQGELAANDIINQQESLATSHAELKTIYRTCTNLSDERIEEITYSEDTHVFAGVEKALSIGLATGTARNVEPADATWYIYDGPSDDG
ncbi:ClpP family protease [Sinorhizobium psoraleae]|uniref:ATP-dependent Clp protease proteolytic subunit n=1 Tax=Sinorhizobium psoraleae TaxID=520838 RepID=A0ABT4KNR3_9HYPH|nr:ATP-dependent Clp protease proteolytic subunit [Sinorhizobium psoraleae]MCZ4093606.1 ATP-dependent Clp protease proteolytic subunit [Sinorhizobium psoraleae]